MVGASRARTTSHTTPCLDQARFSVSTPDVNGPRRPGAKYDGPLPFVHIVIVTYQGAPWILRCVRSIARHTTYKPFDVLVVDNGSTDGTPALLASEFPAIDVVPLKRNVGFGRGNNLGIQTRLREQAGYVVLLNQDTVVEGKWLSELMRTAIACPDAGAIMPVILSYSGQELDANFGRLLGSCRAFIRDAVLGRVGDSYVVDKGVGAAVLLTPKMLDSVGLFDPIFFLYGEDTDLFRRMRHHGFGIVVSTRARVRHGHTEVQEGRGGRKSTWRAHAVIVSELKNPLSPVHRSVYRAIRWVAGEAGSCVVHGFLGSAVGYAIALIWGLMMLPRILVHRRRCMESSGTVFSSWWVSGVSGRHGWVGCGDEHVAAQA